MIALPVTCPLFIGRRPELETLQNARRELAKSHGSFVAIGGEAGVGKSRLVRQFVERSGDRRVRNLARVECLQGAAGEPLGPLRTSVETLLATAAPDAFTLPAQLALARLAPGFASERARSTAATPVDRPSFFAGLVELLAAFSAKRSTIVIVEDVHWADESTLDFLAYLAPRLRRDRLMLVATYRVEDVGTNHALRGTLARIAREETVRHVQLEPFERSEVRALITAALQGRAPLPEPLLETIASRSEGNAFFAEELLKEALTPGLERRARLPLSIRGIVLERLAGFDAKERRVLSYAAVLGLRFDPNLLAQIAECPVDDLVAPLARAREAALLSDDADEPALMRFRHALTRQVIYDELLAFDVARLHRRILETLETTGDARLYALAEHAALAGDATRTLAYGERAGEAAWALGGYAEAIACFERALHATTNDADRARLTEKLGFPVSYGGDTRRGIALWEEALAIFLRSADYASASRLLIVVLCERFNLGESDDGELLLTFLRDHEADLAPLQRARITTLVACLRSELGHMNTVDGLLERVPDDAALPADVRQNAILTRINRAAFFGRVDSWKREVDALESLATIHEKPSVAALNVADHLASVVSNGLYLGTHAELEAVLSRGRTLVAQWGFQSYTALYDALEAAYALTRGRVEIARRRFFAGPAAMHLTSAVLARTAPYLALALGEAELVDRVAGAPLIARERAALRAEADSPYSRLAVGGYAIWLERCGRTAEAATLLAEAFTAVGFPSPRLAPLVSTALRHFEAARIPNLAAFADLDRREASDAAGRATAMLAGAALLNDARGLRAAAHAFMAAGYPLDAAHAFHVAGDVADARRWYERSGAIGYLDASAAAPGLKALEPELSEREEAVARLIALGCSNHDIAERMAISRKTVEKHVSSTFRKLGLRSRSQISSYLAGRNASDVPARRG